MGKPLGAVVLLCVAWVMSAPAPASALSITITTDQVTGAIGGTALGAVGGPVGGFIGGVLGKELGKTIERRRRGLDAAPPQGAVVHPAYAPIIDPGVNDRTVDSTPMRVLDDLGPAGRSSPGLTLAASPDPDAPQGTLDYQLNQIVSRHPDHGARLMRMADGR